MKSISLFVIQTRYAKLLLNSFFQNFVDWSGKNAQTRHTETLVDKS